jgi:hypothetical protein
MKIMEKRASNPRLIEMWRITRINKNKQMFGRRYKKVSKMSYRMMEII